MLVCCTVLHVTAYTLHAWEGIPKTSCHGPGQKHPVPEDSLGMGQPHGVEGVLEGVLLTLSPWPSLMPCCVCHVHLSLRSGFAGWDRCSWGILRPSKSHLFAAFQFSSPASLQVGAHPVLVQSSNHKAKVWGSCGLGARRHFELSCSRDVREALHLTALPRESSQGKLLLSYLCTVTSERKLEVTVIAVSHPCSPGLGRETTLAVTAKPAIS